METLIRVDAVDTDGVLLATIDMPGRSMNVFSVELMDALEALMDRVDGDSSVRSVVLTSGKGSFLAGADLVMVQGYTQAAKTSTHAQMFQMCGRLGRMFVRLEASAKPWVAALNGLALGGGLELALACRKRIVIDDPRLQLGTPEVRWGLLPGAGGTQRLPRMAGFDAGMDLLVSGRSASPQEALKLGIVDAVVTADTLIAQARAMARSLHGQAVDWRAKFRHFAQDDVPAPGDETVRGIALRHGIDEKRLARYPAYRAIIDSVLLGARLPLAEATTVEMQQFLRLMFSPVAARMIRTLFLERLRAERQLAAPPGCSIAGIEFGTISAARAPWEKALSRLKLPVTPQPSLPTDTLRVSDTAGQHHRFALRVLDEPATPAEGAALVLCPGGPYGTVIEVLGQDGPAHAAAAALAARLWAMAWPSLESVSVLQRCARRTLDEQLALARSWMQAHPAADAVFFDVAACVSGVSPAWSGGPLVWADEGAN